LLVEQDNRKRHRRRNLSGLKAVLPGTRKEEEDPARGRPVAARAHQRAPPHEEEEEEVALGRLAAAMMHP
jgi:hypothetical protein